MLILVYEHTIEANFGCKKKVTEVTLNIDGFVIKTKRRNTKVKGEITSKKRKISEIFRKKRK